MTKTAVAAEDDPRATFLQRLKALIEKRRRPLCTCPWQNGYLRRPDPRHNPICPSYQGES